MKEECKENGVGNGMKGRKRNAGIFQLKVGAGGTERTWWNVKVGGSGYSLPICVLAVYV